MVRHGSILAAVTAAALLRAGAAVTVTPVDILGAPKNAMSCFDDCMLTGVVSLAFTWQNCSCIVVSEDDPDGPGIYVGGMMPGCEPAVLEGGGVLRPGDVVHVYGRGLNMLLEPGFVARRVVVVGHTELPRPKPRHLADIARGVLNNRRVRIDGVLWSARVTDTGSGPLTILRVGTADGPVRVRLVGDHRDLNGLRDSRIEVDGIAMAMCNGRSEYLETEIEALGVESVVPVSPRLPDAGGGMLCGRDGLGLLAFSQTGYDGHMRGVRGDVTYSDRNDGYCIIRIPCEDPSRTPLSVRVDLLDPEKSLPRPGDFVTAWGFPVMSESCSVLEDGVIEPADRGGAEPAAPDTLTEREVSAALNGGNQPGDDFNYRFVRLCGRIEGVESLHSGGCRFTVSAANGRFAALLDDAGAVDPGDFVDRPVSELTGVLVVRLARNAENGRVLAVGGVELRLRSVSDVKVLGDAESNMRRLGRLVMRGLFFMTIPLTVAVIGFLLAGWRRRVRTAAVAEDRRRMAEELHDSVSQHIAGARMMIFTVKTTEESLTPGAKETLSLAAGVLESARREVRDAVMRLKSDDVTVKPAEALIRETAEAISKRSDVKTRTKLCAFPSWIAGEIKTDMLSIVHEAITNAVRHGKAKTVLVIADRIGSNGLAVSVLNDGAKFDADAALGPETGHFGLSGMRERAERSGFRLSFGVRKDWVEVRLERGTR